MITVMGAAGSAGRSVIRRLSARGLPVRGVIRAPHRAQAARDAGATEVVVADIRRVEDLRRIVAGSSALFHIAPATMPQETEVGAELVRLAERAGVRIVYSSVMHSIASDMVHHDTKRQVEECLVRSSVDYVILQPARFMQGLAHTLPAIAATGRHGEPFRVDAKVAFVDYEDVAEVAAECLIADHHTRATFELCAPGELTREQQASILSDLLGRPVVARRCELDDLFPPGALDDTYVRRVMTSMFEYYDRYGFRGGDGTVLQALLGRAPTSFRDFSARLIAESRPFVGTL